ncbi:MAG: ribosomal protein S18-alanine N-acetyltransferase [Nitrososphaeria archaeon]
MRLRRCDIEDLDEVERIEKASFTRPFTRLTFYMLLKDCPDGFVLTEDEGKVIGYIVYSVSGKKGCIVSLAVLPEHRNKGIGQMLLDNALEEFKSKVDVVELQVSVSNFAAIGLYLKNGFVVSDVIPRYYPDGEDAYVMRKSF